MNMTNKQEAVFMVGIPCSGKSTYIKEHFSEHVVVSFDDSINEIATREGITYYEAFKMHSTFDITQQMSINYYYAIDKEKSIVFDDTFTKKSSREYWLRNIPDHYSKKAIVMHIDHKTYLTRKELRPEKVIPDEAIVRMLLEYEKPTIAEGFDEIRKVKNYESSR